MGYGEVFAPTWDSLFASASLFPLFQLTTVALIGSLRLRFLYTMKTDKADKVSKNKVAHINRNHVYIESETPPPLTWIAQGSPVLSDPGI